MRGTKTILNFAMRLLAAILLGGALAGAAFVIALAAATDAYVALIVMLPLAVSVGAGMALVFGLIPTLLTSLLLFPARYLPRAADISLSLIVGGGLGLLIALWMDRPLTMLDGWTAAWVVGTASASVIFGLLSRPQKAMSGPSRTDTIS